MTKKASIEIAIEILRKIADENAEAAYVLTNSQTPEVLDQVSEGLMLVAMACSAARDSKVAEQ